MSLRPKPRTIYQAGRFTDAAEGTAVFALPNEFHRKHAQPHLDEVVAALSSYFKRPVALRLVVEADEAMTGQVEGRAGPPSSPQAGVDDDLLHPEEFTEARDRIVEDTGVSWATDRLLEAFPGAEEV
jgi:hypothetical protein